MKNNKFYFKNRILLALLLSLVVFNSCTKKFEEFNTDSNGVSNTQLIPDNNNIGGFYPELQYSIVPNNPSGANSLQGVLGEYHISCPFAGYLTEAYPEESPGNSYNFTGWDNYGLWGIGYNAVMAPVNNLKTLGTPASSPDFWAIALILQVAEMHKITDIYGPVPFSKYGLGGTTVSYDNQQSIYTAFFDELDTAVNNLKKYIASFPGSNPFKKFDVVYAGDYSKWLKYANSLRLRLAMHIVKIDPATAKQQALKAIDPANGGVFTSNADNATSKGGFNLLWSSSKQWVTIRAGAAIVSYMDSYNDPRISEYFEKSSFDPTKYIGLKQGYVQSGYLDLLKFSDISEKFAQSTPATMMTVSEVNFLLAEGALRGWNMGGTPQMFYEAGIQNSLDQWGVGGAAITYINNSISKPNNYVDPLQPLNNSPTLSTITIKWDDAAAKEENLERIITQKWIANFPDGTESWTNFRRTGYPKLFPVTASRNNSGGTISTDIQIRRSPYPVSEYTNNAAEVAKAIIILGGPDNGGTRVWWDVNGPNF